ncbi:ribokinase [Candidatus Epulonipiscioides gigas]|nr:ribokinase [Epulopiscium sp. SCG-C07WGA-EpuloA2]
MAKILNFGSLNIDYVYSVDHFVMPGETTSSSKLELFCGGKGLNQSIALSRAGATVYHAGVIGKNGEMLTETLKEANVNIDFVTQIDVDNGHAIIQLDKKGENCIILHEGSNACISKEHIEKTFEFFEKDDFLVLQNEINNIPYIMELAQAKGIKIVLNPSPIDENITQLPLEYVDYFILNRIEAMEILKTKSEENLLEKLATKFPNAHIVLTLGEHGAKYKCKDIEYEQGIFKTNVVDTTAAGDTFLGYFVACISKKEDIKTALEISAKAASITITQKGASNSIPFLHQWA